MRCNNGYVTGLRAGILEWCVLLDRELEDFFLDRGSRSWKSANVRRIQGVLFYSEIT
jgi:hypothetical protein